jgi:hypothetical protein
LFVELSTAYFAVNLLGLLWSSKDEDSVVFRADPSGALAEPRNTGRFAISISAEASRVTDRFSELVGIPNAYFCVSSIALPIANRGICGQRTPNDL